MPGVVTLSVELELGWGMHDKQEYGHLSNDRSAETVALERLLSLADRYNIPITFDIVGHLLEDSCPGHHTGPFRDGWWTEDPGTDVESHPQFYAPDLVKEIQNREVDHEIATHTYSHHLAEVAPDEELAEELSKATAIHREFGLPSPKSIVMPRHQRPNYYVIKDNNIKTIRKPFEEYEPRFSNPVTKLWWLLTRNHPVSKVHRRKGLIETTVTPHPSLTAVSLPNGRSPPHPIFRTIPSRIRRRLHRQYLIKAMDQAIESNKHVHLWTHVYNFANDDQWEPMSAGLGHLGSLHDENQVLIKRMQELREGDIS
ncbi:polysaccharide deacetylase family protein [Halorubrum laminariae]|uniref:Polysaccharide deacetylase family protein n=1 Tax=Halorubrum laminariae TaxID=1433523 RepID=A0ABD6C333_9EURY|nr:polysaccharide deacetylase family protein [Halorubrum laminariae]